jgi:Rps23 Pro-64 3,4-dihydroxylase Tpa1-like proline 4-hydroxylase
MRAAFGQSGDSEEVFSTSFIDFARGASFGPSLESASLKYRQQRPFPGAVFDGWIFDANKLREAAHVFPYPDQTWWQYSNPLERKFALDDVQKMHPRLQEIIGCMQSALFTNFLERLTGIQGLIVDQTLRGGGLHCSARGGKLDLHIDHNVHPVTGLDRRVNAILYLNTHWEDEWNGALEFWEDYRGRPVKLAQKVRPAFGKLVVFNTGETSWHGHPDPLMCPEGYTRKSVALYYWTNGRPKNEQMPPHSTIYAGRPGDPPDPRLDELRAQRAKGRLKA